MGLDNFSEDDITDVANPIVMRRAHAARAPDFVSVTANSNDALSRPEGNKVVSQSNEWKPAESGWRFANILEVFEDAVHSEVA